MGGSSNSTSRAHRTSLKRVISSAALDLVLERGLDAVTVDEIARAANVSRRTFFNYFPSKTAACVPDTFPTDSEAVRTFVSDRSEPTLTAVGRMLWHQVTLARRTTPEFDRFHDLWRHEQDVRSEIYAALARTETILAGTIARRDGADTGALEPRAVAAAAMAILRVAVEQWRTDESHDLLEVRIREAFEGVARAMDAGDGHETAPVPGEAPT